MKLKSRSERTQEKASGNEVRKVNMSHYEEQRAAADRGERSQRQKRREAGGHWTHKEGSSMVNMEEGGEAPERRMLEHKEPLQAVTISLVLPKHRIHAGNNSTVTVLLHF